MLPPRTRLDPDGYYHCLGLQPEASHADIVAAFRGKARLLHPDVPSTGDAVGFVAVRQAYDVLSNRDQRAAYDRKAREALDAIEPEVTIARRTSYPPADPLGGQHQSPIDPADRQDRWSMGSAGRPDWASTDAGGRPDWSSTTSGGRQSGFSTSPWGWQGRSPTDPRARQPRVFDIPILVWAGLGAFLCLSVYEAAAHLMAPPRQAPQADIRPNAAVVAPLSPSAHEAVLYGPAPVQLAGVPNFYVGPGAGPAMLWYFDKGRNALVPLGQLPPFSMVQAVRLIRQNGLVEVLVNDRGNGLISANRLTPGNTADAHRAYCGYNAGPTPRDGELLERHGSGTGKLELENRAMQPAVVKLRDDTGAVVISVFLGPQGHAVFNVIPDGTYHPEFAIGELWSRACNSFAAGMRAWRMQVALRSPADWRLVVEPDAGEQAAANLPDQAFERN